MKTITKHRKGMRMTIKELAKLANVSVATVSRVMNNDGVVTEETRKKVLKVANEVGYHSNLIGRNLRRRQTDNILVMLTSLSNTFCNKVIRAIDKEAEKSGYSILVCATNGDKDTEKKYVNFARNKLVDGMIILNSSITKEEMQEYSKAFPIVQCCEYVDKKFTPYVTVDSIEASFDAVSRLIKSGRKRIAFFTVDNDLISTKERLEGYKKALKENHIDFDPKLVFTGNYGYRNAISQTEAFMDSGVEFDGLFAVSDRMAAGAIKAIIQKGKTVPGDVAVTGFDNTDASYITTPSITTVAQPANDLGKEAFNMLCKLIKKEKPQNKILDYEIISRESTIN
ncbi:MAG: LacI family transcriptional regulator [Ruminococcaceae bacterium]|nr:LacI family transcriptional regulator [Oscillospiraceae bacterium]